MTTFNDSYRSAAVAERGETLACLQLVPFRAQESGRLAPAPLAVKARRRLTPTEVIAPVGRGCAVVSTCMQLRRHLTQSEVIAPAREAQGHERLHRE